VPAPKKISIFGGGIGGLAAAFALTEGPLRHQHRVTIYQMGWRLGGKGASGRNRDAYDRVEEHGLHIWLGCYENAFRLMRQCYEECRRNNLMPNSPFQTVDDAFEPQHLITMMEQAANGQWKPWPVEMPPTNKKPGTQRQCISVVGAVKRLLLLLDGIRDRFPNAGHHKSADRGSQQEELHRACRCAKKLREHPQWNKPDRYKRVLYHLDRFQEDFEQCDRTFNDAHSIGDDRSRRRAILVELAVTLARGIVRDVLLRGHTSFDVLDDQDFRDFLRDHGASRQARESAPVRAAYEIVFAYENGLDERPSYSAAVAVRFMLRWVLTYEGALIYRMQAGMGDAIFSPLYLALKNRGVDFKFFHRINQLHLAADKRHVASVDVDQQVTLEVSAYDPFVSIQGIPCWPSKPNYVSDSGIRQIRESEQIGIERLTTDHPGLEPLESAYSPWRPRRTISLNSGADFDSIVLAIPLGALPLHCQELIDHSPGLATMVQQVPTIGTQSFQLWMNKSPPELGFEQHGAILDSYLDSWADFSHLEQVEGYPADTVRNIAYFSRTLPDAAVTEDESYYVQQTTAVMQSRRDDFLNGPVGMRPIWPAAYAPGGGDFDWDLLVDHRPHTAAGRDRFDAQFWCANVNPSDRYIQSLAGTIRYRLKADESGFENVVLAGDWIKTGLDAGCIEGATVGGLQAARAISGHPKDISGEDDLCRHSAGFVKHLFRLFAPLIALMRWICRWCGQPTPPAPVQTPIARYIQRSGDTSFSPPFEFIDVQAHLFFLDASQAALQRLADAVFNQPSGGAVRYVAPVGKILLACCDIGRSRPLAGPGSQYGYVAEQNLSFWIPLFAVSQPGRRDLRPIRVVWYQPYTFVNQDWAPSTGREVYGFGKSLAEISFSGSAAATPHFSVAGLSPRQGASQVVPVELVRVFDNQQQAYAYGRQWQPGEGLQAAQHLIDMTFESDQGTTLYAGRELRYDLNELAPLTNLTLVFLKQFRDADAGDEACYQGIIEAVARPSNFSGGSILTNEFKVEVESTELHPFESDFGWDGNRRSARAAVRLGFDFIMQRGRTVHDNVWPR